MTFRWRHLLLTILLLLMATAIGACSSPSSSPSRPAPLPVSDDRVQRYLAEPPVNRADVGLEPIPVKGDVYVIDDDPYVRLEFERPNLFKIVTVELIDGEYRWFAEEDEHYGPREYDNDSAGIEREAVYIAYGGVNGPGGGLYVSYSGPRKEYLTTDPDGLPLSKVTPLLEQWSNQAP